MPNRSSSNDAPLPDSHDEIRFGALAPEIYAELRSVAAGVVRQQGSTPTLHPTALVHEVYLRFARREDRVPVEREHFLALAARAMRQIIVDHVRRRDAVKRGGDRQRIALIEEAIPDARVEVDADDLERALEELARLDERQSRIVELRFLAGLTVPEVATVLGVSEPTVKRDWRMARAWLLGRLTEAE